MAASRSTSLARAYPTSGFCPISKENLYEARVCPLYMKTTSDPLTPALSQQARLGELATQSDRIRERMRLGRGSNSVLSPRPYPLADTAADAANTPCRVCVERDRVTGDFPEAAAIP